MKRLAISLIIVGAIIIDICVFARGGPFFGFLIMGTFVGLCGFVCLIEATIP